MECTKCGADLDFRDAFCSKCGELTQRSRPVAEQLGKASAELGSAAREIGVELARLGRSVWSYVRDAANRKRVIAGGVILLLLVAVLTDNPIAREFGSLFEERPGGPITFADGTPNLADYEDVFLSEPIVLRVIGEANVRNYPTANGTSVDHTLSPGQRVHGREVAAFDPTTRWFKLTSGGYLWAGNLAGDDGVSVAATRTFPEVLQGRWSNNSACEGSEYPFWVEFLDDQYLQLGEAGTVKNGIMMPDGAFIFELNMRDDRGAQYSGRIEVRMNGARNGIRIEDLEREWARAQWWYRESVPCSNRGEN